MKKIKFDRRYMYGIMFRTKDGNLYGYKYLEKHISFNESISKCAFTTHRLYKCEYFLKTKKLLGEIIKSPNVENVFIVKIDRNYDDFTIVDVIEYFDHFTVYRFNEKNIS